MYTVDTFTMFAIKAVHSLTPLVFHEDVPQSTLSRETVMLTPMQKQTTHIPKVIIPANSAPIVTSPEWSRGLDAMFTSHAVEPTKSALMLTLQCPTTPSIDI